MPFQVVVGKGFLDLSGHLAGGHFNVKGSVRESSSIGNGFFVLF